MKAWSVLSVADLNAERAAAWLDGEVTLCSRCGVRCAVAHEMFARGASPTEKNDDTRAMVAPSEQEQHIKGEGA